MLTSEAKKFIAESYTEEKREVNLIAFKFKFYDLVSKYYHHFTIQDGQESEQIINKHIAKLSLEVL